MLSTTRLHRFCDQLSAMFRPMSVTLKAIKRLIHRHQLTRNARRRELGEKEVVGRSQMHSGTVNQSNFISKHILVVDIFHLLISYLSEVNSRNCFRFYAKFDFSWLHFVNQTKLKSNNSECTNNLSA